MADSGSPATIRGGDAPPAAAVAATRVAPHGSASTRTGTRDSSSPSRVRTKSRARGEADAHLATACASRELAFDDPAYREPEPDSAPHDVPASSSIDFSQAARDTADSASDEGLAYQSLFGPIGDGTRKTRRERKPATAMQRALGLLTRREHSRKELTRKLVSRGVDAGEVDAAVDKLVEAGWQNDRRFAEGLVRSRASSGYGPLHIRAELGTHDLPAEIRQAALDDFEGDWSEIARDLVTRRFGRMDDVRTRERKAADYLIRRGFPGDIVRAAIRSAGEN